MSSHFFVNTPYQKISLCISSMRTNYMKKLNLCMKCEKKKCLVNSLIKKYVNKQKQ